MKLSLKLFISFILVIALVAISNAIAINFVLRKIQKERLATSEVVLAKQLAKKIYRDVIEKRTYKITDALFDEITPREENLEYFLVFCNKGYLLAHTYLSSMPRSLFFLDNQFKQNEGYKVQHIVNEDVNVYDISVPIKEGIKQVGTLHLGIKNKYFNNVITPTRSTLVSILYSMGFIILVAVLISLYLSGMITDQINYLIQWANKIGAGELNSRVKIESKDELGQLAITFNKMAQQLETANSTKSEFVANISHEIRTPLNGIVGFAEIISNSDNIEQMRNQGRLILQESDLLLELISDLLDHSKMDAEKMELESVPFKMEELVDSLVKIVNAKAEEKGLIFKVEVDKNLPDIILGDPFRVRQIILNLLSNAIKFTAKGSVCLTINVLSEKEDMINISFSVIDTGIGLSEIQIKKIFESFMQADGSTTRKYGGTGLGTTIVKRLTEKMNGRVSVQSKKDEGSTFTVEIPFKKYRTLDTEKIEGLYEFSRKRSVASESGKKTEFKVVLGKRILVADDNFTNQQILKLHLEPRGYLVEFVDNGLRAVEKSYEKKFDIILMDLQMPELDGIAATKEIRAGNSINKYIPIIALTANAYESTKETVKDSGMDDWLTKPIRVELLFDTIYKWLTIDQKEDEG